MTIMSPEPKRLWLEALRSGEYVQTTGFLCDGAGYCCLGVACEIAAKDLNLPVGRDQTTGVYVYDGQKAFLPLSVQEWLGMFDPDPHIPSQGASLAELNDQGYTFDDIADWIENEL